jgi:hypothetical protein
MASLRKVVWPRKRETWTGGCSPIHVRQAQHGLGEAQRRWPRPPGSLRSQLMSQAL